MAPDAGFEPATKRLTAAYSTAELIRNVLKLHLAHFKLARISQRPKIRALSKIAMLPSANSAPFASSPKNFALKIKK